MLAVISNVHSNILCNYHYVVVWNTLFPGSVKYQWNWSILHLEIKYFRNYRNVTFVSIIPAVSSWDYIALVEFQCSDFSQHWIITEMMQTVFPFQQLIQWRTAFLKFSVYAHCREHNIPRLLEMDKDGFLSSAGWSSTLYPSPLRFTTSNDSEKSEIT